ncbi:secondary thiamine-phosphate synthase enzyme YjbQ [Geobacter grbiciae]|uniref:secondary thiamine-phosphate synthase enzyme YjbQ n=1 Tax=Geobacter grbiciae TaxID=155042 RepID=UPI001C011FFD|nr:secondary thiamine-phosphate synthase enzyme YjbQ [Geobacter grbiciae]MBT1076211.1 secondary thiamine-phosphate synthase enzyme YjbQ [Geobacter grbiciae]
MVRYLEIRSKAKAEFIDITSLVREQVRGSGVTCGVCHIFVLHTTAGLTINEGADPAVQRDILTYLDRLVPRDPYFTHKEGNSDAHIKSTLTGTSLTVFFNEGKLLLGTWQSIYLCEFDGPRQRKVALKIVSC